MYFPFCISLGRIEKVCRCTDNPENDKANAVNESLVARLKSAYCEINAVALLISRNEDRRSFINLFFTIPPSNSVIEEKKIINEETIIEFVPADMMEEVILKV